MDEQQIRAIIREELGELIKSDRFTFYKLIQILDGRNIQTGRTTGTKIGTETSQKIGLYNVTPTAQQSKIDDPANSAATYNQANAQEAVTAIKTIIDALETLGITASS